MTKIVQTERNDKKSFLKSRKLFQILSLNLGKIFYNPIYYLCGKSILFLLIYIIKISNAGFAEDAMQNAYYKHP